MKKVVLFLFMITIALCITSCGGGGEVTAPTITQEPKTTFPPITLNYDETTQLYYSDNFENAEISGWYADEGITLSQTSQCKYDQGALLVSGRTDKTSSVYINLGNQIDASKKYSVVGWFALGETKYSSEALYAEVCYTDALGKDKSKKLTSADIKKDEYTKLYYIISFEKENSVKDVYIKFYTQTSAADFYVDNFRVTDISYIKFGYNEDMPSLFATYSDYFKVGCAISPSNVTDKNSNIYKLLTKQFNCFVTGNEMKQDALQKTEGNFSFESADKFVAFGEAEGVTLRGHTLVWHSQVPEWFFTKSSGSTEAASSQQLVDRIETHIATVMGRYKGKIDVYDVVNEVISDNGTLRMDSSNSKYAAIVGDLDNDGFKDDYIEKAFYAARAADPDATLIINDYGIEGNSKKCQFMYDMVERMLGKGVPIDGVGFQMHINLTSPSISTMRANIEKIAELRKIDPDFTIQITELDISVYSSDSASQVELTPTLQRKLAKRYMEVMALLAEMGEKGYISEVVFWGLTDGGSWLNNSPVEGRDNYPLLFDNSYIAKPAFWSVINKDLLEYGMEQLN